MEVGSTTAVINAVAADAGISLVSEWSLSCPLQSGLVVAVPVEGIEMRRNFYFLTRRRPLPRHLRALIDFLSNAGSSEV
jgi:DNA-binding transcriptional LysR family regulator